MKNFSIIFLTIFLLCTQNTAFAIVVHNNDQTLTVQNWSAPTVTKQKKQSFVEKFVAKKIAKIAEMAAKDKNATSQGDKLATLGFWGVIGSVAISTIASLASSGAGIPAGLSTILTIASLLGLILCIVALTRDDLSAQGRKMAKWGIGVFLVLLALALILILAVLAAFA